MSSFDVQLSALLDGPLSPADEAALLSSAASDPDRLADYLDLLEMHAVLRYESRAAVAAPAAGAASAGHTPPLSVQPATWALPIAAALLLSAAAIAVYLFAFSTNPQSEVQSPESIATLIESTGTVIVDNDIASEGEEYSAGTYSLDTGEAQFILSNRVAIGMRGRTELQVHGPMSATLVRGRISCACPPGTETYTVLAPRGVRVVDLGTRFDVAALPDRSTWVHVTEGLVRIDPPGRESRLLRAGEHVVVGSDAIRPVRLLSIDFNRDEPRGETAAHGPRVWGDPNALWNSIAFDQRSAVDSRITIASRVGADLVDASGQPTGVTIEVAQPDRRWHVHLGANHAVDPIRTDSIFMSRDWGLPEDRIAWRITGLIPGEVYELALLSQFQNGAAVHPTDFVVADREPAVLDAELYAVFAAGGPNEPLIADADGVLRGFIQRRPDQQFAAWTGLQLRGPLPDLTPAPAPHDPPRSQPSPTIRTEQGDTE